LPDKAEDDYAEHIEDSASEKIEINMDDSDDQVREVLEFFGRRKKLERKYQKRKKKPYTPYQGHKKPTDI
jgi:hypothetical protein